MQMLAEKIATDPNIEREDRDLGIALEAAKSAMRLAGNRDPETQATVALVHYHRGEVKKAISYQKKAWMLANPRMKPGYKRVLDAYHASEERTASLGRP